MPKKMRAACGDRTANSLRQDDVRSCVVPAWRTRDYVECARHDRISILTGRNPGGHVSRRASKPCSRRPPDEGPRLTGPVRPGSEWALRHWESISLRELLGVYRPLLKVTFPDESDFEQIMRSTYIELTPDGEARRADAPPDPARDRIRTRAREFVHRLLWTHRQVWRLAKKHRRVRANIFAPRAGW